MKKALTFYSFFLFFSLMLLTESFAQLKPNTHLFRARVIDKTSKKHIPYALVNIKDSHKKHMTNSNGDCEFEIPYPMWRDKKITIETNFAGYKQNFVVIKSKRKKKDDVYIIKLTPLRSKSAKL